MNGWLWAAVAALAIGTFLLVLCYRAAARATNPDDYGGLVTGFLVLCVFGGAAGLLGAIGFLVKLF